MLELWERGRCAQMCTDCEDIHWPSVRTNLEYKTNGWLQSRWVGVGYLTKAVRYIDQPTGMSSASQQLVSAKLPMNRGRPRQTPGTTGESQGTSAASIGHIRPISRGISGHTRHAATVRHGLIADQPHWLIVIAVAKKVHLDHLQTAAYRYKYFLFVHYLSRAISSS